MKIKSITIITKQRKNKNQQKTRLKNPKQTNKEKKNKSK